MTDRDEVSELRAQLEQRANGAPQWTTEPPTKPGWYWWRGLAVDDPEDGPITTIAHVWYADGEMHSDLGDAGALGAWCGPLEPPP